MNGNCHIFFFIATGQFCLLSYWLAAGIWAFPCGFPKPSKNCPEAFQQSLGISQHLSYTLVAVPSVQQPLIAFPSCCHLKRDNFHPFPLKGRVSVSISENSKEHLKIKKTTSGSFYPTSLLLASLNLMQQSL